jgi:2-methylisocitrate lyase-like PEP mutase family enzyme
VPLREIISRRQAVLAPGAANALFARIIEDIGFECVYVTGAGIANMALGAPDIGLTSIDDIAQTVSRIADAVSLPLINTWRTMKVLERAGASAIQLEDQDFPKRCGHFSGKGVIPLAEMLPKIKAAADARTKDTLIIARTDALAVDGLDAALERAEAFIAAGADMTFVEAPRDADQMRRIAALGVPQVANIVHGGKTPPLPQAELAEMGYGIVLYANAALQAAVRASTEVLSSLKATGSLEAVHDRLASFEERQAAVAKGHWDALEQRFKAE